MSKSRGERNRFVNLVSFVPRKSRKEGSRQRQIFLSHASTDQALARLFVQLLETGCGVPSGDILFSSNVTTGVTPGTGMKAGLPISIGKMNRVLNGLVGGDRAIFAIIIDVDRLKQINSRFGANVGSRILLNITELLDSLEKENQNVLSAHRCGDDTYFVVVYSRGREAMNVAHGILKVARGLSEKLGIADLSVGASAGVAEYEPGEDVVSWFERAYAACAQARDSGGGSLRFFGGRPRAFLELSHRL